MESQQFVNAQIKLMEELLEETRKTNALLTDIFAEQLDSNAMLEDTLLVAFGLDGQDEDEDEDDVEVIYTFGDDEDSFEDDEDFFDDEDEDDESCGDPFCPVCGSKDFDDDDDDDFDFDEFVFEDFNDFDDEDEDDESCGDPFCPVCGSKDFDDDDDDFDFDEFVFEDFNDFDDEDDFLVDEPAEEDYDQGCGFEGCPVCYPVETEVELSFEQIEDMAYADMVRLTSEEQLPYTFFGRTIYQYTPDRSNPVGLLVLPEKNRVVAMLKDATGKVVRRGVARCMPYDTFSAKIGGAIAIHRLFELEIPEVYTK